METKRIPIKWQGKDSEVVIKRLTFGERNHLADQCREVTWIGGVQKVKVFEPKLKIMTMKLGIQSAPFKLDDEDINGLDGTLGEKIYIGIDRFNTLDQGKADGPQKAEASEGDSPRVDGAE